MAYAYLDTKIQEIIDVSGTVTSLGLPFDDVRPLPIGSEIPNAMPHKATVSAQYTLPLPEEVGKVTFGGTYVYQSKYRAVSDPFKLTSVSPSALPIRPYEYGSEFGVLPASKLLNLNLNWGDIFGLPIDAGLFATNVTNEKVYQHANVQAAQGFVSNIIGEPRMWGARLRYKFGG